MNSPLINSAALYFGLDAPKSVPFLWLDRALAFFLSRGISVDYFDIAETDLFSSEETYDFEQHKESLFNAVNAGRACILVGSAEISGCCISQVD